MGQFLSGVMLQLYPGGDTQKPAKVILTCSSPTIGTMGTARLTVPGFCRVLFLPFFAFAAVPHPHFLKFRSRRRHNKAISSRTKCMAGYGFIFCLAGRSPSGERHTYFAFSAQLKGQSLRLQLRQSHLGGHGAHRGFYRRHIIINRAALSCKA